MSEEWQALKLGSMSKSIRRRISGIAGADLRPFPAPVPDSYEPRDCRQVLSSLKERGRGRSGMTEPARVGQFQVGSTSAPDGCLIRPSRSAARTTSIWVRQGGPAALGSSRQPTGVGRRWERFESLHARCGLPNSGPAEPTAARTVGWNYKPKAAVTLRTASITGTPTSPTNAAVPAIVPSARRSAPYPRDHRTG